MMNYPLKGIKVLELAGLAPGPFCGKILLDWGASVIRVDKPNTPDLDQLSAGKRSIIINSKNKSGQELLHRLCDASDVLIDPYRPGVLERLGFGPSVLHTSNPGLIYTRITGYGQTGPYSMAAGHDINYIAMSGILSMLGRSSEPPTPPINLLADFAGGGLTAALGVLLALLHRNKTGEGQVVDCSMTEGAAYVGSFLYCIGDKLPAFGRGRGHNWLDTGAHFYETYETSDGRFMAVGAIEPQFYQNFLQGLGLAELDQFENFEDAKKIIRERFKTKTMAEWSEVFDKLDACVSPVLTMDEAPHHAHQATRQSFIPVDGGSYIPSTQPVLSNSPAVPGPPGPRPQRGEHTRAVLNELGYSEKLTEELLRDGAVTECRSPARKSKL